MADCPKHGPYNEDHGCGTAVWHGSSMGEHILNCPLVGILGAPQGNLPHGGFFKPNDGERYPPWEAPAGNCPGCWHEAHPDQEVLEFSAFGAAAKARTL